MQVEELNEMKMKMALIHQLKEVSILGQGD